MNEVLNLIWWNKIFYYFVRMHISGMKYFFDIKSMNEDNSIDNIYISTN